MNALYQVNLIFVNTLLVCVLFTNIVYIIWGYMRKSNLEYWNECSVLESCKRAVDSCIKTIEKNYHIYQEIEKICKLPAWAIAGIHFREASFDFKAGLCNGEPWNKKTTLVPKNVGPFKSWSEAAIYALQTSHLEKYNFTKIEQILDFCEAFNGLGYKKRGMPSPYIFGATNVQTPGRYVADHVFDPKSISKRPGVAAIALHFVPRTTILVP
jgi:lysozyme family protein